MRFAYPIIRVIQSIFSLPHLWQVFVQCFEMCPHSSQIVLGILNVKQLHPSFAAIVRSFLYCSLVKCSYKLIWQAEPPSRYWTIFSPCIYILSITDSDSSSGLKKYELQQALGEAYPCFLSQRAFLTPRFSRSYFLSKNHPLKHCQICLQLFAFYFVCFKMLS